MAEEKWVIVIHNDEDPKDWIQGALGDADDVISIINEMIDNHKGGNKEENIENVCYARQEADGQIHGSLYFINDDSITYNAKKISDIFAASFIPEYADYEINAIKQRLSLFSGYYTDEQISSANEGIGRIKNIRRLYNHRKITVDEAVSGIQEAAHM